MTNMSKAAALAHATSSTEEPQPRARVRTDTDGLTVITTMQRGAFQSVFYTRQEVESLIKALRCTQISPSTTFAVEWGKDRNVIGLDA